HQGGVKQKREPAADVPVPVAQIGKRRRSADMRHDPIDVVEDRGGALGEGCRIDLADARRADDGHGEEGAEADPAPPVRATPSALRWVKPGEGWRAWADGWVVGGGGPARPGRARVTARGAGAGWPRSS